LLGAAAAAVLPLAAAACIFSASVLMPESSGGQGGSEEGGAGGSSTTMSATGSASASGAGGGDGAVVTSSSGSGSATGSSGSGGCMPQGTCATKTIYVYLDSQFSSCASSALDIVMSESSSGPGGNFREISQFKVFISPDSNTTPLNICKTGSGSATVHRASLGGAPCVTNELGVTTLGYVSTTSAPGYEQLSELSVNSHTAIVLQNATNPAACCHDNASCTPAAGYVPTN
jgi:hypothetical protein